MPEWTKSRTGSLGPAEKLAESIEDLTDPPEFPLVLDPA